MTRISDVHGDLQAESSGWLFKSPLAGGGILWWLRYWLHSLLVLFDVPEQLNGSVKEPNISIYFFFRPSLNGVLFPMFCLLVEGEYQILVF